MPYSTFISVDFPAPFSPTIATNSPAATYSDTSSTANVGPKDLVMCRSEIRAGRSGLEWDADAAVDDLLAELLEPRERLLLPREIHPDLRPSHCALLQPQHRVACLERPLHQIACRFVHGEIHVLDHRAQYRTRRGIPLIRVDPDGVDVPPGGACLLDCLNGPEPVGAGCVEHHVCALRQQILRDLLAAGDVVERSGVR